MAFRVRQAFACRSCPAPFSWLVWLALLATFHGMAPALRAQPRWPSVNEWHSPAVARLQAQLDRPFHGHYIETPVTDVLAALSKATGIQIAYFDAYLLEEASESPITKNFDGISARETLRLVLYRWEMDYQLDDNLLTVVKAKQLEAGDAGPEPALRVYDLGPLLSDGQTADELAEQLRLVLPGPATTPQVPRFNDLLPVGPQMGAPARQGDVPRQLRTYRRLLIARDTEPGQWAISRQLATLAAGLGRDLPRASAELVDPLPAPARWASINERQSASLARQQQVLDRRVTVLGATEDRNVWDVLDEFRQLHQIERNYVMSVFIQEQGLGPDTPRFPSTLVNVTMRNALRRHQAALKETFSVRKDALLCSDIIEAAYTRFTRTYDVSPLLDEGESARELRELLLATLPNEELPRGYLRKGEPPAPRQIALFGKLLMLRDTEVGHIAAAELLATLAQGLGKEAPKLPVIPPDKPAAAP